MTTPQEITETFRRIWDERGSSIGRSFTVAPCPFDVEQIKALDADGRRLAYLPPEAATREGRHLLGQIFPKMDCYSVRPDNVVHNVASPSGWFDYEVAIDAPNGNLDQAELLAELDRRGHTLLSLNQYIVATQDSRLLTGSYLDEARTWLRVNSYLAEGELLAVRIDGDEMAVGLGDEEPFEGSLLLGYDVGVADRTPVCGARSSTVPADLRNLVPEPARTSPRWSNASRFQDLDLQAEWQRSVDTYLALGFHTELCMTEQQYVATLPRFEPRPAEYRDRFDMPLLVETRLFWRKQAQLAGVNLAGFDICPEPVPADERFRAPAQPYTAWFASWGRRFPDRIAPPDARAQLAEDEVGANPYECAAVEILHPEFGEHGQFWDILGAVVYGSAVAGMPLVDHERTLSIYRWRRRPEICPNLHQHAFEIFRPLVRGSRIVTYPGSVTSREPSTRS